MSEPDLMAALKASLDRAKEKHAKTRDDRASHLAHYGCCGASCKEDCTDPPCPCNPDYWSEHELRQLRMKEAGS